MCEYSIRERKGRRRTGKEGHQGDIVNALPRHCESRDDAASVVESLMRRPWSTATEAGDAKSYVDGARASGSDTALSRCQHFALPNGWKP